MVGWRNLQELKYMIINYLNKKQYTIIDLIGQCGMTILVYNQSWIWLSLLIPIALIKHLLKRWSDFNG